MPQMMPLCCTIDINTILFTQIKGRYNENINQAISLVSADFMYCGDSVYQSVCGGCFCARAHHLAVAWRVPYPSYSIFYITGFFDRCLEMGAYRRYHLYGNRSGIYSGYFYVELQPERLHLVEPGYYTDYYHSICGGGYPFSDQPSVEEKESS